jgi:hypothetical protein
MKRLSVLAVLAIGVICSPSVVLCSFPPDIRVVFEGWSGDSKQFALRKTVIDTADDSVAEDVLYVVDLSSSGVKMKSKEKYNPQTLQSLSLVKVGPVGSSDAGAKTFILGEMQYVYLDYATVMESVGYGESSYTIHRRIWMLDRGMAHMIFKEDESFSNVSTRSEIATEAHLSPDTTKLLVLFKITSHFEERGFIVLDLTQPRVLEKGIRVLD